MKPKIIYWGIIGAGKIAHKFTQDLKTLSDCKLLAIASRDLHKSKAFALKHDIDKAYGTYEALVEDTEIDAVYIATPHSFHKAHSILAISHGKAVLCEKPLAMNSQEVNAMISLAKKRNVLLMEALWTAFLPHFLYVKTLIANKHFGMVLKLNADFGFYTPYDETSRVFDKSVGGGSLLDIGIYPIFLALSILGKPIKIDAKAHFFPNKSDSECRIRFEYQNDVHAFLESTLLRETKTEATLHCETGTIRINSRFHEPSTISLINAEGKEITKTFNYNCIGYRYEIEHFNELLRKGKTESDIMTFEKSETLMQLLDAVRSQIGLHYA